MKKYLSICLMALVAVFVMTGCASKEEQALSKLDSLVERVQKNAETMTDEDWEQVYADYQAIGLDNEELQFSDEQNEKVGEQTALILKEYAEHTKKSVGEKVKDTFKRMGGFLKGLGKKDGE